MTHSESKFAAEALSNINIIHFDGKQLKLKDNISYESMMDLYAIVKYRTLVLEAETIREYVDSSIKINDLYKPDLILLSNELKA